jgi:hypothetical protein
MDPTDNESQPYMLTLHSPAHHHRNIHELMFWKDNWTAMKTRGITPMGISHHSLSPNQPKMLHQPYLELSFLPLDKRIHMTLAC